MSRKALNLNIKSEIYERLSDRAAQSNLSKTRIVETALDEYFSRHTVDEVAEVVDGAKKPDNAEDTIPPYLWEFLSGVACPVKRNDVVYEDAIALQNRKAIADLEKVVEELQAESLDTSRALGEKITQHALDQRLAQALEPIWESMDYMAIKIENLQNPSETPPSEIGLVATKEDTHGGSILNEKEGDMAQNIGDTDNEPQNTHGEGSLEEAIAPKDEGKSSSQTVNLKKDHQASDAESQKPEDSPKLGDEPQESDSPKVSEPEEGAIALPTQWMEPGEFSGFLYEYLNIEVKKASLTSMMRKTEFKGEYQEKIYRGFILQRKQLSPKKYEFRLVARA
jgi:predicted transcriptional regulator